MENSVRLQGDVSSAVEMQGLCMYFGFVNPSTFLQRKPTFS